jgi:hypothetical protein
MGGGFGGEVGIRDQHEEGTRDGVEGNTLDTGCICTSPNRIKLGKTTIVEF